MRGGHTGRRVAMSDNVLNLFTRVKITKLGHLVDLSGRHWQSAGDLVSSLGGRSERMIGGRSERVVGEAGGQDSLNVLQDLLMVSLMVAQLRSLS